MTPVRLPETIMRSRHFVRPDKYHIEPEWVNPTAKGWLDTVGWPYSVRQGSERVLEEATVIRDGVKGREFMEHVRVVWFLDFEDEDHAFEFKLRWL